MGLGQQYTPLDISNAGVRDSTLAVASLGCIPHVMDIKLERKRLEKVSVIE